MNIKVPLKIRVNQKFEDSEDLKNLVKLFTSTLLKKEDIFSQNTQCRAKLGGIVSYYTEVGSVANDIKQLDALFQDVSFDPLFYRDPVDRHDPLTVNSSDQMFEFDIFIKNKYDQCVGNCGVRGTTGFLKIKGNENGYHDAFSLGIKEKGKVLGDLRKECH